MSRWLRLPEILVVTVCLVCLALGATLMARDITLKAIWREALTEWKRYLKSC